VTTPHVVTRQSTSPIIDETCKVTRNVPPLPYGFASAAPYGGGLEEIHIDDALVADMFTPPPHGVGA